MIKKTKEYIKRITTKIANQTMILYEVKKHPKTPLIAKCMAIFIIGYILSPIDLIPDFIPVLGYLDDVILLPIFIYITIKLIPNDVWGECKKKAKNLDGNLPYNWMAAIVIIFIWLIIISFIAIKIFT